MNINFSYNYKYSIPYSMRKANNIGQILGFFIFSWAHITLSACKLIGESAYSYANMISEISGGVGHVTIISWRTDGMTELHYVNLTATTQNMLNSFPYNYTGLSQVPTKSLWNQSSQLIQGPNGGFYDNAFWVTKYQWTAGSETSSFQAIDEVGAYLCRILYFASNSSNFIEIIDTTNNNSRVSFTGFLGMETLSVKISNQQIFILLVSIPVPTHIYIKIVNLTGALITTLTQTLNTRNVKFEVRNNFMVLGYNTSVLLYTIPYYYKYLQVNLTAAIVDLATDGVWLVVITNDFNLTQYEIVTGQMFFQTLETRTKLVFYTENLITKIATYSTNNNILGRFASTNEYVCPGGCTVCRAGYTLVSGQCIGGTYIAPFFPTPPSPPSTPTVSSSSLYPWCLREQKGYCVQFCQQKCETCSPQLFNICLSCAENYHINAEGQCVINSLPFLLAYLISLLSIFRSRGSQSILFLLGNLQLYDFHYGTYEGVLQRIFTMLRFIKQKQWELIPIPKLVEWFDEGYRGLPNYNFYTNPKFLQQERSDSIFFQNTKDYFLLYFPLSMITFYLLKLLFKRTFHHRLSIYFRLYSLNLYLLGIILFNDFQFIIFLSLRNFQNLFSFDTSFAMLQALTLTLIGLFLICSICLYFWYRQHYGELSRYFLINLYYKNYSQKIMLFLYVLRPIVLASIHAIVYSSTSIQLILLTFSELATFIFMMLLQIFKSSFKIKLIFCLDLATILLMFFLNILIQLKFNIASSTQLKQQFQHCILINVYILSFTYFFNIIISVFIYPLREFVNRAFFYEKSVLTQIILSQKQNPPIQRQTVTSKIKKMKTILTKIQRTPKLKSQQVQKKMGTLCEHFYKQEGNSTIASLRKQNRNQNHKTIRQQYSNKYDQVKKLSDERKTKIGMIINNANNVASSEPVTGVIRKGHDQKTRVILRVMRNNQN